MRLVFCISIILIYSRKVPLLASSLIFAPVLLRHPFIWYLGTILCFRYYFGNCCIIFVFVMTCVRRPEGRESRTPPPRASSSPTPRSSSRRWRAVFSGLQVSDKKKISDKYVCEVYGKLKLKQAILCKYFWKLVKRDGKCYQNLLFNLKS